MPVLRMITVETSITTELAELSMFANELHEARDALAKSLDFIESDEGLMARHLVNAGVIAYFRCFMMSGKRKSLDKLIEIPSEFEELHETMRAFRNKTVAHIDSGLRRTIVWLGVEDDGEQLVVRYPSEMTIHMDVPPSVIRIFIELIEKTIDLVVQAQERYEAKLVSDHGPVELAELWARTDDRSSDELRAMEWNPASEPTPKFARASFVVSSSSE